MTFSIVARCQRTGQVGVAAATAVQAVGKLACHAIGGVGAIASQALTNPYLAYDGLRLLERGLSAEDALKRVLATDVNANRRQVGVIDNHGRVAAWTGPETIKWAGHLAGRNCSIQGNRLAGPQVLEKALEAMHDTEHLDLAERLTLALLAGDKAGGDLHGERSVNVLVFSSEEYALCDIRIDDHEAPLDELRRLYKVYQEKILPNVLNLPKRSEIPRPQLSGKPTCVCK
ncbi:MAG: fimA [Burkholderia sp.]|nr:fimA [Burkholderia sp.]